MPPVAAPRRTLRMRRLGALRTIQAAPQQRSENVTRLSSGADRARQTAAATKADVRAKVGLAT